MPLSAPEYWLEWTKNYFRCQFTQVGELIHKETWSAASFGWAEGLQTINPPIYRLTTAVSDIDQTNINRDIRDGNWLSTLRGILTKLWSWFRQVSIGQRWSTWTDFNPKIWQLRTIWHRLNYSCFNFLVLRNFREFTKESSCKSRQKGRERSGRWVFWI